MLKLTAESYTCSLNVFLYIFSVYSGYSENAARHCREEATAATLDQQFVSGLSEVVHDTADDTAEEEELAASQVLRGTLV